MQNQAAKHVAELQHCEVGCITASDRGRSNVREDIEHVLAADYFIDRGRSDDAWPAFQP